MRIKPEHIEQFKNVGIVVTPYAEFTGQGLLGYGCRVYNSVGVHSSSIGCHTDISSLMDITSVGNYSSIAHQVGIARPHPTDRLTTSAFTYSHIKFQFARPSFIGHDVWIGMGVAIKAGMHIGNGAIIGAGAVVTHDVPEFAIVGGVPAKIIRMRFSDAMIERIQKSQWFLYEWEGVGIEWNNLEKALDTIESKIAEHSVSKPKMFVYQANEHSLSLKEFQK